MRRIRITLLGLSIAALGCDSSGPAAPELVALRSVANSALTGPFHAHASGALTAPFVSGRCPALTTAYTTTGEGVLVGRFVAQHTHCLDPAKPGAFTDGTVRLTAANGDQLWMTYAGQLVPTGKPGVFGLDNPFGIVGGTGRFADASGGGRVTGWVDLVQGVSILDLDGIITFDPGARAGS